MMICVMDVGWNRKKNFIQPPETPYEKKICVFQGYWGFFAS